MKFIISIISMSIYCAPVVIKYDDYQEALEIKKIIKKHLNMPESFIEFKTSKCSEKIEKPVVLEVCLYKNVKINANRKMLNKNYKIFRDLK